MSEQLPPLEQVMFPNLIAALTSLAARVAALEAVAGIDPFAAPGSPPEPATSFPERGQAAAPEPFEAVEARLRTYDRDWMYHSLLGGGYRAFALPAGWQLLQVYGETPEEVIRAFDAAVAAAGLYGETKGETAKPAAPFRPAANPAAVIACMNSLRAEIDRLSPERSDRQ